MPDRFAGHIPVALQFLIESGYRDGKAGHFLAGQLVSRDGVVDHDFLFLERILQQTRNSSNVDALLV